MTTAIIKKVKNKRFSIIDNRISFDKNLSMKAKGLLFTVLTLPDDWHYSVKGLCGLFRDKQTAMESAIKELKENGYLIVKKIYPNEKNNRIVYEYTFFEQPQKVQGVENQGVENQGVENQGVENQGVENQGAYKVLNVQNEVTSYEVTSYEKTNVQNSSTEEFCVPPTSQSEVVANAQNSPSKKSHSSQNEEKTADEKIEHIENEMIEPEKTRLPEKTEKAKFELTAQQAQSIVVFPTKFQEQIAYLVEKHGVKPQIAHDWLMIRKDKRLKLTQTALNGILRQLPKGYSLNDALTHCCVNGWAGFKYEWVINQAAQAMKTGVSVQQLQEQREQQMKEFLEKEKMKFFDETMGKMPDTEIYAQWEIKKQELIKAYNPTLIAA